jgi:two-component system chemotaxis sensor kinase CheA
MSTLGDLTERLLASLVALDPNDLPALADMHTQCQTIRQQAGALEARQAQGVQQLTETAERLLTQVILRESGTEALEALGRTVAELQQIVSQAVGGEREPVARAQVETLPAAPAADASPSAVEAAEQVQSLPNGVGGAESSSAPPGQLNSDDLPLLTEFIVESRGHIETAEAAVLKVEEQPDDIEAINAIFRSFHTVKGVAGFLNLTEIGSLAHSAETLLDLARKGELRPSPAMVDVILEAIDLLKEMVNRLEQEVGVGRLPGPEPRLAGVLNRLKAATAAGSGVRAESYAAQSATEASSRSETNQRSGSGGVDRPPTGMPAEATVKVATDRLDSLINMVGELVIAESMVRQSVSGLLGADQRLARNVAHLGKITRELQGLSMSMRMVPIQGVFQKVTRLVRDLARKACKEIEMVSSGGETELDRNVVEAISDPLVHMIRNAVDHGIEPPEERVHAGKPRCGRIDLRAFHQGGSIVIQISDDGRGLNKRKILRKALDSGLIREGQEPSEQEIFALIFHPGLSTADRVTDVSGRGVGMDVVKRNIEALRGRVEIASVEGRGTTFTVRLPLTLAVIDGLIAKVGPENYIIPLINIEQSLRPTARQLSMVQGRGEMCMVRGSLLPLYRLHRLFNVRGAVEDPTEALLVIVQNNQRRACLLVDRIVGQQQVVIKSLGERIGKIQGITGGAILGDGNISMILDVPSLMEAAAA